MAQETATMMSSITQYFSTPVQVALLVIVIYLIRQLWRNKTEDEDEYEENISLEPMERQDFTLEELRPYDGKTNPRILVAVNGKVFDVSPRRNFYGPDGPYSTFAGRDASRSLATFSIDASCIKEEYDDLSDLNSMQMDQVQEWELQFMEKYEQIGKLLKPGEPHTDYKGNQESEDERTDGKSEIKSDAAKKDE